MAARRPGRRPGSRAARAAGHSPTPSAAISARLRASSTMVSSHSPMALCWKRTRASSPSQPSSTDCTWASSRPAGIGPGPPEGDERGARQADQPRAQGDLVGGDRQPAQQVAGDPERDRLVQVAGHQAQVAAQQLAKMASSACRRRGLVGDPQAARRARRPPGAPRPPATTGAPGAAAAARPAPPRRPPPGAARRPAGSGKAQGAGQGRRRHQQHPVTLPAQLLDGPLEHRSGRPRAGARPALPVGELHQRHGRGGTGARGCHVAG